MPSFTAGLHQPSQPNILCKTDPALNIALVSEQTHQPTGTSPQQHWVHGVSAFQHSCGNQRTVFRLLCSHMQGFSTAFGQSAYESMNQRWQGKLARAAAGEQLWGKVTAVKPQ
jgi:hypothetical protein